MQLNKKFIIIVEAAAHCKVIYFKEVFRFKEVFNSVLFAKMKNLFTSWTIGGTSRGTTNFWRGKYHLPSSGMPLALVQTDQIFFMGNFKPIKFFL